MGQGRASERADRRTAGGGSAAESRRPEADESAGGGQSDREIWVTLYAVELAGGEGQVTDAHEAAAEQAWTASMAEIQAMDAKRADHSEP